MPGFDEFMDTDRLPAASGYAALVAKVEKLQAQLAETKAAVMGILDKRDEYYQTMTRLQEQVSALKAGRDLLQDELLSVRHERAEVADALMSELAERDTARQALRDLVDATSWYGPKVGGHIRVSEGAMDVAMALVVAWSKEE